MTPDGTPPDAERHDGSRTPPSATSAPRVRFIDHRGVRILHLDFAGIKTVEGALAAIAEARDLIAAQPRNSLLTLTDVKGSIFNAEIARAMWRLARHDKPFVRAGAVVGLDPAKEIILNLVQRMSRRTFGTFKSPHEAKEWLVERSGAPPE